ncbi:MAG: hypothetical protein AAB335_08185, partial [candidate division NC10 bacterium]
MVPEDSQALIISAAPWMAPSARPARRCYTLFIEQIPTLPLIIQGGMGAAVSDWRLANAVARTGQLGVVSG